MKQKHVGMQKVVSVLLLVALLLTLVTPAFAEGGPGPDKMEPIVLVPDYSADVVFDNFQAQLTEEGTYEIDAELTVSASELDRPLYFEYSIDMENRVYSTRVVDEETWKKNYERSSQERSFEDITSGEKNEETNTDALFEEGVDELQRGATGRAGIYNLTVRIVTKDPPQWWLTATTNRLKWRVYRNGKVRWLGLTRGCRGYTTRFSHWYVLRCSHRGPLYRGQRTSVSHYVFGKYQNYDFLNPRKGTWVEQWVTIIGKSNGHATIRWHHRDWGEAHQLIRGVCIGC